MATLGSDSPGYSGFGGNYSDMSLGSGSAAGSTGRNPAASGRPSGSWTNLENYLQSNQGFGGAITGQATDKMSTMKGAADTGWNTAMQGAQQGQAAAKTEAERRLTTAQGMLNDPTQANTEQWKAAMGTPTAQTSDFSAPQQATYDYNQYQGALTQDPRFAVRSAESQGITGGGQTLNDYLFVGSGAAGNITNAAAASGAYTDRAPEYSADLNRSWGDIVRGIGDGQSGLRKDLNTKTEGLKTTLTNAEKAAEVAATDKYFSDQGYTKGADGQWGKTVSTPDTFREESIYNPVTKKYEMREIKIPGTSSEMIADYSGQLGKTHVDQKTAEPNSYANLLALQQLAGY